MNHTHPISGEAAKQWLRDEAERRSEDRDRSSDTLQSIEQELADAHAERDELRRMLEEAREGRDQVVDRVVAAEQSFREQVGTILDAALTMASCGCRESACIWAEGRIGAAFGAFLEEWEDAR